MPIYIPDSFDSVGDAVVIGGTGGAGRTTFVSLNDTPSSYSGEAGKIAAVNSGETGLEFIAPPTGTSTFTGLNDTPSSYAGEGGKLAAVNVGETALEFINPPSGTFLGLTDVTNTTYTGLAGAVATVNAGETGMELISASDAGQTVVKGASSTSFGYLVGQVINRQWYRPITPTAARAIGTTFGMEGNAPLNFKATGTSMTVTGQVFCDVAPGEVLSLALSDSSVTFNDVGFTEITAFENGAGGSHPIYSTIPFDFQVSGLTAGSAYTWYLALKSSSTSSRYLVGLTAPAIVLEAKHAG